MKSYVLAGAKQSHEPVQTTGWGCPLVRTNGHCVTSVDVRHVVATISPQSVL